MEWEETRRVRTGRCGSITLFSKFVVRFILDVVSFLIFLSSLGRAAWTRHIRNGKELPEIARDNNYDFNFQVRIELSRGRNLFKVMYMGALFTLCRGSGGLMVNMLHYGWSRPDSSCEHATALGSLARHCTLTVAFFSQEYKWGQPCD